MNWWQKSILAGILAAAAFPPMPTVFAFALIPAFLWLIRIAEESPSARAAMMRVYPGLLVWNILTTYWLAMATVGGGVAAILANAVVMSIPFGLYRRFRKPHHSHVQNATLFIALYIGFEWTHHQWDLAWPWLTLGNAFSNATAIIQWIELTGVLGLSAWILTAVFLAKKPTRTGAAFVALPVVASLVLFFTLRETPTGSLPTLIVQPNIDSYAPYEEFGSDAEILDTLMALTSRGVTDQTALVLWPENSIEGWVYPDPSRFPNPVLQRGAMQWNSTLIGGATYFKSFPSSEEAPIPHRLTGSGIPYTMYNAALAWQPDGSSQVYGKRRLVPIVERLPFVTQLAWLMPSVDWTGLMGFGKGTESANLPVGGVDVTGLVCYDSVFPGWVRRQVRDGAGIVGIITNDGWWGDTGGHEQHFAYARLRAIETRRAVARSANNGISGVILPDGSVSFRTDYWTRVTHHTDIPIYSRTTLYVRFGDIVIGGLIVLGLAISFGSKRRYSA
jgi:apolipoprotein N-acyltransferase